jgi:hypothetical protein
MLSFVVEKVALGQDSSEPFGCPCQFSLHQVPWDRYNSTKFPWTGTVDQILVDIQSGPSFTPPREVKNISFRLNQSLYSDWKEINSRRWPRFKKVQVDLLNYLSSDIIK